jgi:RHS repeat-associated protein
LTTSEIGKTPRAVETRQGQTLRSANYTINVLNQITSRDVPGYVDVLGSANANATVTVNLQRAYRYNNYFQDELAVANTSSALYLPLTNLAVLNNGTNADIIATNTGNVFLAQEPETFGYDADGNMTNDGRFSYTWDAENRLINLTSLGSAPSGSQVKLDFAYDSQGRRIQKIVSTNNGSIYIAQSTNVFVYDGWNLIAETEAGGSLIRSYIWGLDLSGSMQGAGGVGGLLEEAYYGSSMTNCFMAYDGNGNVAALANAADGTVSANYEYDPFGQVIRATGPMAKANPFRFSTKYQDDESGLNYYGYRFYNPSGGRWLSRDPLEEIGGLNLYGFVDNNPVSSTDIDGRLGVDELFNVGFLSYDLYTGAGPATIATDVASLVIPFVPNPKLAGFVKPIVAPLIRIIKGEKREVQIVENASLRNTLAVERPYNGPTPKIKVQFQYKGLRDYGYGNWPKHFHCVNWTQNDAIKYTADNPRDSQWKVGFTDDDVQYYVNEALKAYVQKFPQATYSTIDGFVYDFALPHPGGIGNAVADAFSVVGYSNGKCTTKIELDVDLGGEIHAFPVP